MNIVNRVFLKIVLAPAGIYQSMGINTHQLKAILFTKLLMDDRRPNTIQQTQAKKQKKPISAATLGTMLMTGLMGLFFIISFFIGKDLVTQTTIYFSFFIFVLSSTLISDFTSVLIDIRDNMIILPKPISDKTFLLGRLLHIIIHISKLVIPMTIPAIIFIGMSLSPFQIIPFLLLIVLATLLTIFLINALYVFILKVTTPEKFKAIISYFQIFFAIAFYASYQLVPRLINKAALENFTIGNSGWAWLSPPFWFAGSFEFLSHFAFTWPLMICFFLSITVPIASIWLVIKYFAPNFNQKLSMISGSESETPIAVKDGINQNTANTTSKYLVFLSAWLSKPGPERMAFLHTWKMTSRSRDFKMKVYPSLGYLVVYLVMMFLNTKKFNFASIQNQTTSGKIIYITLIYFCSFILILAISQIMYSDKFKAAWIYFITPIAKPGLLISGAVKSMVAKFYLPMVTILSIVAIAVMGPTIIPNLILGLCNQLLIVNVIAYITVRNLPFAQMQNQGKAGFIRGLFTFLIPFTVAGLHYFIYSFMPVVIILSVLSGIACWLVMDAIKHKQWSMIKTIYEG